MRKRTLHPAGLHLHDASGRARSCNRGMHVEPAGCRPEVQVDEALAGKFELAAAHNTTPFARVAGKPSRLLNPRAGHSAQISVSVGARTLMRCSDPPCPRCR